MELKETTETSAAPIFHRINEDIVKPIKTEFPICIYHYLSSSINGDEVKVMTNEQKIQVSAYNVSSGFTQQQIKELEPYGIDMSKQLQSVHIQEYTKSIIKNTIKLIHDLCEIYKPMYKYSFLQNIKRFIYKLIGKPISDYIEIKGSSTNEKCDKIARVLIKGSNVIARKSRMGHKCYAIVSPSLGIMLQNTAGFKSCTIKNYPKDNGGPIGLGKFGTISSMVDLYVDEYMNFSDQTVYMGLANGDDNFSIILPYIDNISFSSEHDRITSTVRYSISPVGGKETLKNRFLKINLKFPLID
jgi:hypothetical protein